MLKELYNDSFYGRSCIFKKAWKLAKYLKIKFADALFLAWHEIQRIFKNPQLFITLTLHIFNKQLKVITDLKNSIMDCLEIIGYTLENRTLYNNISKDTYENMNKNINLILMDKPVTFHQDIYVTY